MKYIVQIESRTIYQTTVEAADVGDAERLALDDDYAAMDTRVHRGGSDLRLPQEE